MLMTVKGPQTLDLFLPVLRIRTRRIRMFLGLLDPDLDPLVKDIDPSIIKQK
jgi:hypothetical protein